MLHRGCLSWLTGLTSCSKAAQSGAEEVSCDPEDSVPEIGKHEARRYVAAWLAHRGTAWVQGQRCVTPHHEPDIAEIAGLRGCEASSCARPSGRKCWRQLVGPLGPGIGIVALIATALGVQRAYDIRPLRGGQPPWPPAQLISLPGIDAAENDQALLLAGSLS